MNGQSKKPLGFLFLALSIFMAYHSFGIYTGDVSLPYDCSGTRQLVCDLVNILFKQSGYFVVVLICLSVSVFAFVIAYRFIVLDGLATKSNGSLSTKKAQMLSNRNKNKRQTINDVLVEGQEPTNEFLEELNALHNAPALSDDELKKQALSK